jgi:diacylglycerol kinase (ATP)
VEEIPVILNPAARSAKASGRLEAIKELSDRIKLCPTTGPGDARRIARELALAGASVVVAAGGDGTINEIVNGLRDAGPEHQAALGLLPSGTMNVFSVELGLPVNSLVDCWEVILRNQRKTIDLWDANGHAFMQLAGVGLDAEIIKETTWERKKALGPLSYVISAAQCIGKTAPQMNIFGAGREPIQGSVVLVGNGKRYGGPLKVFPQADNQDGLLDVVVLRRHSYGKVFAALLSLLLSGYDRRSKDLEYFQTKELRIESDVDIPVEADGELINATMPLLIRQAERPLTVLV